MHRKKSPEFTRKKATIHFPFRHVGVLSGTAVGFEWERSVGTRIPSKSETRVRWRQKRKAQKCTKECGRAQIFSRRERTPFSCEAVSYLGKKDDSKNQMVAERLAHIYFYLMILNDRRYCRCRYHSVRLSVRSQRFACRYALRLLVHDIQEE